MKTLKIIAILFIVTALILGTVFYLKINYPIGIEAYLKKEFYSQFGALAICIELLIAGYYLFKKHKKANFTLALFGFTITLDTIFNYTGLLSSSLPLYATIIFMLYAIICFWLSFTDSYNLGKISFLGALASFILGNMVELFFNYW